MHRFPVWIASCLLALAIAGHADAKKTPKPRPPVPGAFKVGSKMTQSVGKVRCVLVGENWVPGTSLKKGWFVAHARQRANFARLAESSKGAKKQRFRKLARTYGRLASKQRDICEGVDTNPKAPPVAPVAPAAPAPTPVRFDIDGAAGLALKSRTSARQGIGELTLQAISGSGQITDGVASGNVSIAGFFIAPDKRVVVAFSRGVNLDNSADWMNAKCMLAIVDPATNVPACLDAELSAVAIPLAGSGGPQRNPAVQFDGDGGIYYLGSRAGSPTSGPTTVLRRISGGVTTDLVSDNINVWDYLVLGDGSVLINGQTGSTGSRWVRRVTPGGGLESVANTESRFLQLFPDGNAYVGLWGPSDFGIRRYATSSSQLESKYWISGNMNGGEREAYFNAPDYCAGELLQQRAAFCGSYGTSGQQFTRTSDGKVFAVAGSGPENGLVTQYYPSLAFPVTALRDAAVMEAIGSRLVVSGLNAEGRNITTLLDPAAETETQLIGPDSEIEIYHLNAIASENKVLFDGLRFADNRYVLGQVDLATGQVTIASTLGAKWADFQTFG